MPGYLTPESRSRRILPGDMGSNLLNIHFHGFHSHFSFSSVDPIFSNRLNNPRQTQNPLFSHFYACEQSHFKTRIKTKITHYFKKLTTHFCIR